ncbi:MULTISPECIES: bifunctional methylenetetrahydrofolate dehydrogenase/methenyltetrahydrofolate cyclohydrolase FolD [Dethiosulfovibrio]|uniref:Bifunctional protein FolD n=2 Tax=Dethiosulfovibrio TaxID=47054 RepID=A0ABS9ENI7_9BACT|nr:MULTISPECIES: bifunctional methylenetetrahydrofolate dehydrogenase/methenyltetrahydrofolate cyclohydrolase FolD [Dethiosulfovibrio]MCF4114062.1 bifunctional methylenetetrahydrofolate dehydrogenase/methenyltetrahydrofolate cyclohydrolase FolD [Dethiosulfovibrio russensis]MCF4142748.1 bifunctional methylenetetrahydrofolate dehydrogenase/methenyltetrahydrofolate cyclohydrolase FolD [Dethiosulfovibrio marinus]MCF4144688.1 bifunctional methylenetetrahydrofolate dehydrogenase/methenyltetrahydrofola
MNNIVMDGRAVSKKAKETIAAKVLELGKKGIVPSLAVVLVGDDPASKVYAGQKKKNCESVGISFDFRQLPGETSEEELLDLVEELNRDDGVNGILVEMPLPGHISNERIQAAIDPDKDVDGSNPANLGRLMSGLPSLRPCTPQGAMYLMESYDVEFEGKHAVVVGRSNIVGKPVGMMLLEKNATVTYCHSRTANLTEVLRSADIVVAAVGRPKMIKGEMIKPGAVVVDVGINSTEDGIVGDVDYDSVASVAGAISPVPGGVGPLTIAMLLGNVVASAERRCSES